MAELEHPGCGGGGDDDGEIVYRDGADADDVEGVAALLEQYVRDEPSKGVLPLDEERVRQAARPWAAAMLRDGDLFVVARLGGRIVGAALNFHASSSPQDADDGSGWLSHYYATDGLHGHRRFVLEAEERADVFGKYAVDRALEIGLLVCVRDMRGRGVATQLVRCSLALAASRGYPVVESTATSAYSRRVFEKAGFDRLFELSYEQSPNAAFYSKAHIALHRGAAVYAKRLAPVGDATS